MLYLNFWLLQISDCQTSFWAFGDVAGSFSILVAMKTDLQELWVKSVSAAASGLARLFAMGGITGSQGYQIKGH